MQLERLVNPRAKRSTQPSTNTCCMAGHALSEASSIRNAKAVALDAGIVGRLFSCSMNDGVALFDGRL